MVKWRSECTLKTMDDHQKFKFMFLVLLNNLASFESFPEGE